MSVPLVAEAALAVMSVAFAMATVRLLRGPRLADRVMALDLAGVTVAGMIAAMALLHNQPVQVDVGLAVALVAFVGTIAFARFIEKGEER
ncbi:MAG: monovalent cation/H+ antiporter complex subunit F [Fimbriimonadales bacterium]|nr:monovalent cation/H+ antiporter complex subunit F [Fimbriimonadales bacterium]